MRHHLGIKHLSERVRNGELAELELDRRFNLLWLDRLALAAGILGPFTAIPQLWTIVENGSAGSVSLWAWLLPVFTSLIWTVYGLAHREKVLVVSGILSLVVSAAIVFAIVLYS